MDTKLLFEEDNGVLCSQLPDGVGIAALDTVPAGEYEAARITDTWVLRAPGFGSKHDYGSGAIYVYLYLHLDTDYAACYVARCKCGCGGIVFAATDDPRMAADNAKEVSECIREGHTVGRTNAKGVRVGPFGCQVLKAQMALDLDGGES